jgi:hypothetical protein
LGSGDRARVSLPEQLQALAAALALLAAELEAQSEES